MTDQLTGAALQASSYSARPTLELAAEQVLALDATTRGQMERVQVTGTDFVTLSGGSGSLTVTLVNGLEQPITVGLHARTDSPQVKIETPEPVSMQPGQRTTLRLRVTSGVGRARRDDLPGDDRRASETGTPLTFSLRTSQVGRLIWYIIIAGGTLLAVMIVRRIALRIRSQPLAAGANPSERRRHRGSHRARRTPADSRSLLSSSAVMAAGTIVSRLSGFVRGILLAAALGVGLHADVFNIANTVPNMLYILLAGGVVNAVLVPQLVRAMKNDPDGGEAYTNRIITLAGAVPRRRDGRPGGRRAAG